MTAAEAVHKAVTLVAEAVRKLDQAEAVLASMDLVHSARACKKTADEAAETLTRLCTIEADLPYRARVVREDVPEPAEPASPPHRWIGPNPPHMEHHPDDKEQQ